MAAYESSDPKIQRKRNKGDKVRGLNPTSSAAASTSHQTPHKREASNRYKHNRKKVDVKKAQRLREYRKKNGLLPSI